MLKTILFSMILVVALAFGVTLYSDDQYSSTPSSTATKAKGNVTLTAKLMDEAMMSKDKMAMTDVKVSGVKLAHHGSHLHYQIDDSPIIVTNDTMLSFANLSSGKHTINVTVVDAKHQPLAGPETIEVNIP
jgi:hypothetical protein